MYEWLKDTEYLIMDSRHPNQKLTGEHLKAYQCWKKTWEKFYRDLGVSSSLHSDGFLLCDEIGAIFYKNECVGLTGFTYGSLLNDMIHDHSWFSEWSPESYAKLKAISEKNSISSQFTISPDFAGKNQIVRWKEILAICTQLRFIYSDAEVLAGHINLTKGMQNAAGEEFGATVINPNHVHDFQGVPLNAQLVAYQKDILWKMFENKKLLELTDLLTEKMVHQSSFAFHKPVHKLKLAA
jgi:hypothetical protein